MNFCLVSSNRLINFNFSKSFLIRLDGFCFLFCSPMEYKWLWRSLFKPIHNILVIYSNTLLVCQKKDNKVQFLKSCYKRRELVTTVKQPVEISNLFFNPCIGACVPWENNIKTAKWPKYNLRTWRNLKCKLIC